MKRAAQKSYEPFPTNDRVMHWKEVSRILGISFWTLKNIAAQDKIKLIKMSPRRLGVLSSELTRYIQDNIIPPNAA